MTDRRPALRDALGLVRLLYLDASEGTDHGRQVALIAIGEGLGAALRAAGPPGTRAHAAALARAVAGLERLEDMPHPSGVAELVRAGAQRVRGGPREYPVPEREMKRLARTARGRGALGVAACTNARGPTAGAATKSTGPTQLRAPSRRW